MRRVVARLRNFFQSQSQKKDEVVCYVDVCLHEQEGARKKYFSIIYFLKWVGKLLLPDFLVSRPNLLDNLRTIRTLPQFRPIRLAFLSWGVFSVSVIGLGVGAIFLSIKAEAAGDFSIKTGYYYGNGTSLAVTGLGFTPEVVLIKADTAAGSLVWKSSAMPSNVTAYLGVATADNTENQITLTSDGFTLSQALEVNTVNVRYTYIALAGSDCSVTGVFCVGTYTGDGTVSRAITSGFQPDLVWVKRTTALAGNFRTSSMSTDHAGLFSATANDTTGVYFKTLDVGGSFTVGSTNNTNGGVYYYVAVKSLAGKLAVGQFTGDGVDSRNITGLGFEPDFAFVKQNAALAPAFTTTEMWGDLSALSTATAVGVNHIQDLQADGFQVGNSTSVNALGIISHYFAFGGALDPAPAGSFFMSRGSYTGTGVAQNIETSFAPDLVIVKGNTTQYGVWSTSLDYNQTHYFSNSAVAFTDGVTTMGATGFSVGAHTTVNTNGITYEYIAFGNATSPQKGARASDFAIGAYTGNGLSPRAVDHLGMTPNMVVAKRAITTAALSIWTSSSMAANTSSYFSATADVTDGTAFRSLDSGGFTVGTGATVNTLNATYVWFAFKEGSFFDVGSYVGDAVVDREIGGVGFAPDFVWTKRSTAVSAVHRSSSGSIAALSSQHFMNLANDVNDIKSLTSNGFTLGNSAEVNAAAGAYTYAAWDSSTSSNPPSTPTNLVPSSGATDRDLNVVITGSTYSDPDSNPHTETQWQVDDDADFGSPVWTRSSGSPETSTTVNDSLGVFANELSGEVELDHGATYYWRVRYSDGVWSSWSTAINFTTNSILTPSHITPTDGGAVTTVTPTLSASVFSDPQTGHTGANAQWQLNTTESFTSPLYDSGVVAYSASHAVPSATLSDRSVYYWRVRYQDSSGQWSSYSTPTRFFVAEADLTVVPLFGGSVVDQGDSVHIDVQIKLGDGTPVVDAATTINIFNPAGTKVVDAATVTYLSGSSGLYRYTYTVPATSGSYLYEVTAVTATDTGYGAGNFEVRTVGSQVSSIKSTVESEQIAQAASRVQVGETHASTTDIQTKVTDIQSRVVSVQNNLDILIGAMIVTQSTVNDALASTGAFVTSLTNSTDNFYKNSVLTFTSGLLDGQSRRISAYNGSTKLVTVDPSLTSAPANGDAFTIVSQNVRVEEQVSDHEAAQAAERATQTLFRADTTSRLSSIEGKVDTITTTLNTVDSNLDTVLSTVNAMRLSQQKLYTVKLSDVSEVQASSTYRTKLTILDFESNPVNASSVPQLAVYDSTRALVQATTTMTQIGTGVYEYTVAVAPSATTGLWETIVSVDVGGTSPILRNDYWQVTGSPAQVLINEISDASVPTIAAKATITNEGGGAFEYRYEWCVVSTQENQCGGSDDVYYASAAKLIAVGDSFNPVLTATVPTVGTYWFKLIVYFGTEASGASRTFSAVAGDTVSTGGGGGSGGVGNGTFASQENIYSEIIKARKELDLQSQKLTRTLEILGTLNPSIARLLDTSTLQNENLISIQNKVADLRAVSSATRRIIEQKVVEPIVETYMKFNSVEIHFLITNPDTKEQTVKFKAFLPAEARPEHVMDLSGLKIDYDTNAGVYFVSGDITLGPKETVVRKVEMKDVWVFSKEEISALKQQAETLLVPLEGTQYEAQGGILKNDIESTLSLLLVKQEESYSSPQDHIVAYRENKDRMTRVVGDIEKMKSLVVEAGASRGIVRQVGGIQTFSTWGIVLAIVFGFGLLAFVIFAMWRHQTILTAMAMGMEKEEAVRRFGGSPAVNVRANHSQEGGVNILSKSQIRTTLGITIVVVIIALVTLLLKVSHFEIQNFPALLPDAVRSVEVSLPLEKLESVPEMTIGAREVMVFSQSTTSNPVVVPVQKKLKITATPTGWLNVRGTPTREGVIAGRVYPEEEYEYKETKDGWYKITSGKIVGWVLGDYVEPLE